MRLWLIQTGKLNSDYNAEIKNLVTVVHSFNLSTQDAKASRPLHVESRLVYRMSSRNPKLHSKTMYHKSKQRNNEGRIGPGSEPMALNDVLMSRRTDKSCKCH